MRSPARARLSSPLLLGEGLGERVPSSGASARKTWPFAEESTFSCGNTEAAAKLALMDSSAPPRRLTELNSHYHDVRQAREARVKFVPPKIPRNPLKRLISDERIQGNPSFSNPPNQGFLTKRGPIQENPNPRPRPPRRVTPSCSRRAIRGAGSCRHWCAEAHRGTRYAAASCIRSDAAGSRRRGQLPSARDPCARPRA
jgi:hypothetical protein